jgi:signal transduction histidine kinase
MNTVYGKLLLWSVATLVAGFLAVIGVNMILAEHSGERGKGPGSLDTLFLDQTVHAYLTGGPDRLKTELARIDRHLPGLHYLTDAGGRDLVTGEDRSALLAADGDEKGVPHMHGARVSVHRTRDGKFNFILVFQPRFDFRGALPYHTLLIATIAILCGALAANLARPLRRLARAVDRFGAGDLSVRVNSKRKDEIGDVSRAFDRMADRISTLLTAERRLLQDISHELRSPLARLSFAAELTRTAPDRDSAVARLNKEIARLTDLVGGLIQVTRAEGDPTANHAQVLRLDQLVSEVVEDCRVEADHRHCKIAYDGTAAREIALYGDREVLRRAVENVLRNAIRYTPAGTAIEVVVAKTADTAKISIRDYGPGVPAEAIEKILQPFFRLDDSRDTATGGVGLGLAIAHRAVTLHHGRLWAENVTPGLKVWIEVPLAS